MQIQSSPAIGSAYQGYFETAAAATGADDFGNLLVSTQQTGQNTSSGAQYDFTNMTNVQLLDAAHQLASQGKISTRDESLLVGIASGVDSIPISGSRPSVSDYLQDPATTNFMAYMKERLAWDQSTGMGKAASLDNDLINDFNQFQRMSIPRYRPVTRAPHHQCTGSPMRWRRDNMPCKGIVPG